MRYLRHPIGSVQNQENQVRYGPKKRQGRPPMHDRFPNTVECSLKFIKEYSFA